MSTVAWNTERWEFLAQRCVSQPREWVRWHRESYRKPRTKPHGANKRKGLVGLARRSSGGRSPVSSQILVRWMVMLALREGLPESGRVCTQSRVR